MNLSGYSKQFGEGPDAGPAGKLIERTRVYLQEAELKDKFVYFDEPNMVVYVTTMFGVFVVSIDETQRYGGQLTPWQGISGCSLRIETTPASARIVIVTHQDPGRHPDRAGRRTSSSAAGLLPRVRQAVATLVTGGPGVGRRAS